MDLVYKLPIRNNRIHITNKLFAIFAALQVASVLFTFFHPATSISKNIAFLIVINLTFFTTSIATALFISMCFGPSPKPLRPTPSMKDIGSATLISSTIAIIGFTFLLYDRIILRGIDYTGGLRAARYLWIESEGGSPFGILGNLLTPLSFVSLILILLFYERTNAITRSTGFIAIILGTLGVSALNGGRSIILVAFVFTAIALAFKRESTRNRGKAFKIIVASCFVAGALYSMYIFKSAADMSGSSMQALVTRGIDGLNGEIQVENNPRNPRSDLEHAAVYASAYLFHGQWTAQVMYDMPKREGSYALYPLSTFLERLGVLKEPLEPGRIRGEGAFISVPGAFYYDFGYAGVVLSGFLFGSLFGIALLIITRSSSIGCTRFTFICYASCNMILSPIVPAYGLIYLNLILIVVPFYSALLMVLKGRQFKLYSSV